MGRRFEELDWQPTAMGDLTLRRRRDPALDVDVYEVKLGEEFLMSSLFPVAEIELARLGLAQLHGGDLHVVVGGLGLGYTARAVLEDPRVASLHVVEALEPVIGWHRRGLLPLGADLTGDARCSFVPGDFFALVAGERGFGREVPERLDAVLVDIDHTPRHVLDPSHAGFYAPEGLRGVRRLLRAGGVFGLWSDEPPDDVFLPVLREVFATADAVVVEFPNPLTGGTSANTLYLATA